MKIFPKCPVQNKNQYTKTKAKKIVADKTNHLNHCYRCKHCKKYHLSSNGKHKKNVEIIRR